MRQYILTLGTASGLIYQLSCMPANTSEPKAPPPARAADSIDCADLAAASSFRLQKETTKNGTISLTRYYKEELVSQSTYSRNHKQLSINQLPWRFAANREQIAPWVLSDLLTLPPERLSDLVISFSKNSELSIGLDEIKDSFKIGKFPLTKAGGLQLEAGSEGFGQIMTGTTGGIMAEVIKKYNADRPERPGLPRALTIEKISIKWISSGDNKGLQFRYYIASK